MQKNYPAKNIVISGTNFQATTPRLSFLHSELNQIIPPEIKDDELYFIIQKLAVESNIKTILEIGSSAGGGSTETFVTGLRMNPVQPQLFCMEVSKPRFTELKQRYASESFVCCYNVSSVPVSRFPTGEEVEHFYRRIPSALNDYPLERVISWLRQDIDYVSNAGVPQDGIQRIKQETNIDHFDMVLIDGSEFTGMAELDEVYGAGYILLDDINGFKNQEKPVFLIVDGHPVHRSKRVQLFPYSPELNPDEQVWSHLKHHRLGKMIIKTKEDLETKIKSALRSIQRTTSLIMSFFRHKECCYIVA